MPTLQLLNGFCSLFYGRHQQIPPDLMLPSHMSLDSTKVFTKTFLELRTFKKKI